MCYMYSVIRECNFTFTKIRSIISANQVNGSHAIYLLRRLTYAIERYDKGKDKNIPLARHMQLDKPCLDTSMHNKCE